MAEYYSLIVKAVAGLDKNTGEARRALYERARTALVAQLRGVMPALSESDITRERLALEEAVRKVEAESARQARLEQPRPAPVAANRSADSGRRENAERTAAAPRRETAVPAGAGETKRAAPAVAEGSRTDETAGEPGQGASAAPRTPRPRTADDSLSLTDAGLKGFRDVVAETDEIGGATARTAKSARAAYAAVPSPTPEFDRLEPRMEPEGFRTPSRPSASSRAVNLDADTGAARPMAPRSRARREPEPEEIFEQPPRPARPRAPRVLVEEEDYEPPRSPYRGVITAVVVVMVFAVLGVTAYWQRANIASLFRQVTQVASGPQTRIARESPPTRPKIADRVGQEPSAAQPRPPGGATQPGAAVAQRVVLYEEDPNDQQGRRFVGSAIWRTETVSPGPGLAPELAVRADVEIPDRRLTLTWSLRRNTDQALPASHTIEVMFTLPADFPYGGISNVPGILMKQAEQTRGTPLAGLAVKVTTGFFLIGLSAVEADAQRNLQLLKERAWFDIPIVYNNGSRAILALEKGTPGERAFAEAFAAWERTGALRR